MKRLRRRRKGFFTKLREQQLLEEIGSDRRSQGGSPGVPGGGRMGQDKRPGQGPSRRIQINPRCSSTGGRGHLESYSSRPSLYSSPFPMNTPDGEDDDDMWSFDNRLSSMEINVAPPPPEGTHVAAGNGAVVGGDVSFHAEIEDLIQPLTPRNRLLQKFIRMDLQKLSSSKLARTTTSKKILVRKRSKKSPVTLSTNLKEDKALVEEIDSPSTPKAGGENDELRNLESSIVAVDSPVSSKTKKPPPRRSFNRFMTPSPQKSSPSARARPPPYLSPLISQYLSQNTEDHLSNQISDATSSSSQAQVSPSRTPMSEWIHQDTAAITLPTTDHSEVLEQMISSSSQEATPDKPTSLLHSFLDIKCRYDSSVRLFSHDLRSGKFDDENSLQLFIRKVVDIQEKRVLAVAYDLKEGKDRCVLFRPVDVTEINDGVVVRVYPPWQEVAVTDSGETMVIGTDFYKVLPPSKVNLSERLLKKISDRPLPDSWDIRVTEPLFMDLVPYPIKNQRTIRHHTSKFHSMLDIDILVLHSWTNISPALFLIKDSDELLAFLQVQIPKEMDLRKKHDQKNRSGEETRGKTDEELSEEEARRNLEKRRQVEKLFGMLQPRKYLKLRQVAVKEKILISKKLAPFSVLYFFGGSSKQTFFYTLNWIPGVSECIPKEYLEIPLGRMTSDLVNIDDIYMARKHEDHRICLKCRFKERDDDGILIVDDDSDRSLQIEFVYDPNYEMKVKDLPFQPNSTLLIKFLRVIFDKAIWDIFTTYERLPEDEDDMATDIDDPHGNPF